jgi:hypothetical protein
MGCCGMGRFQRFSSKFSWLDVTKSGLRKGKGFPVRFKVLVRWLWGLLYFKVWRRTVWYIGSNSSCCFHFYPEEGGSRFLGDVATVGLHFPKNSRFEGISSRKEQLSAFKEDIPFASELIFLSCTRIECSQTVAIQCSESLQMDRSVLRWDLTNCLVHAEPREFVPPGERNVRPMHHLRNDFMFVLML